MERSFKQEVELLKLGAGETFHGEGILAVTKALLQSGVAYVGGYQGAPVSHVMDVLNDARDILDDLGVHVETNASEAGAAAMLGASINYPIRGAVAFKSTVGTNVASDALSNLASAGVKGGALVVLGEDYGEGSSIIQERSHAFAMKSQMWLLDPRPNLPKIVEMVEKGFELSEASNTPVLLELRIRACHVHGSFVRRTTSSRISRTPHPDTRISTSAASACRRHLRAGEAQDRSALAGRRRLHQGTQAERSIRGRHGRHRHHLPGRHVQRRDPRAAAARPGGRFRRHARADLLHERRLPDDPGGNRRLLRGQEARAGGRGRPARFIEDAVQAALRRAEANESGSRQGHASAGGRVHGRSGLAGVSSF
jgi:hypothetical protein